MFEKITLPQAVIILFTVILIGVLLKVFQVPQYGILFQETVIEKVIVFIVTLFSMLSFNYRL